MDDEDVCVCDLSSGENGGELGRQYGNMHMHLPNQTHLVMLWVVFIDFVECVLFSRQMIPENCRPKCKI